MTPIFYGSVSDFEALTDEQKADYEFVVTPEGSSGSAANVVNTIENNNPNAVSSGAVYDSLLALKNSVNSSISSISSRVDRVSSTAGTNNPSVKKIKIYRNS